MKSLKWLRIGKRSRVSLTALCLVAGFVFPVQAQSNSGDDQGKNE